MQILKIDKKGVIEFWELVKWGGVKNWVSFSKIKWVKNWCYQQIDDSSMKKKILRKTPMIFDIEN